MRNGMLGVGLGTLVLAGATIIAGAQGPPPPGPFGEQGPRGGGPMAGMFQFGGLIGGFGGKLVTGKPILATFTITHTETMPGNSISNTTTGTFARAADGSTYRDVKLAAIGPWAASGKAQEFAYIRNVGKGTENIVNVTKGTYEVFPIRSHTSDLKESKPRPEFPGSNNEAVTDNPNGTYKDSATNSVYPVEVRKVTRTIPAGAIGNTNPIVITTETSYSTALDIVLEETRSDPRFGTTTYQLTNIAQSPSSSLFSPDPSFTQVQGKAFSRWGQPKDDPPAGQD